MTKKRSAVLEFMERIMALRLNESSVECMAALAAWQGRACVASLPIPHLPFAGNFRSNRNFHSHCPSHVKRVALVLSSLIAFTPDLVR